MRFAAHRLGCHVEAYRGETVQLSGRLSGLVGLDDLRARCLLVPRSAWPALVQDTLEGLAVSREARVDLLDLELVRPLLRSRVYAEGAVLADDVVTEPLAPGLVEVLVAEIELAVTAVPSGVVSGWGVPVPELFVQARRQVLDAGLLVPQRLDLGGVVLTSLESASPFAATHVHWLPSYVDVPGAGALVALPTRHLLLVAPMLERTQTLDAAQTLLVNADRLWRDGPGGLSPDLWWWHPPRLVPLPGSPTSLSPPPEFVAVLDALAG